MKFKETNEYLKDIVAQVDVPLLEKLSITFFHQVVFDTRQLAQFIGRAPKLEGRNGARVVFSEHTVRVTFLLTSQALTGEEGINVGVFFCAGTAFVCNQVCNSALRTVIPAGISFPR